MNLKEAKQFSMRSHFKPWWKFNILFSTSTFSDLLATIITVSPLTSFYFSRYKPFTSWYRLDNKRYLIVANISNTVSPLPVIIVPTLSQAVPCQSQFPNLNAVWLIPSCCCWRSSPVCSGLERLHVGIASCAPSQTLDHSSMRHQYVPILSYI